MHNLLKNVLYYTVSCILLFLVWSCQKQEEMPVTTIETLTGDYVGICYSDQSSLNINHEVEVTLDTFSSEITVSLGEIMDSTGFTLNVGEPSLWTTFFLYNTILSQDTIDGYVHWSYRSHSVTWVPSTGEMNTFFNEMGFQSYQYVRSRCFYQKTE